MFPFHPCVGGLALCVLQWHKTLVEGCFVNFDVHPLLIGVFEGHCLLGLLDIVLANLVETSLKVLHSLMVDIQHDRVDSGPDLERGDRDFPAHEHGDDDGRSEPAFIGRPDQDLVAELLLDRQIGVRAIASEHPVEQDLVSIEDLDVHILGGRSIEHDRPGERLKSRMRQRPTRMGVPLSTRASRRRGHREEQDRFDAIERVVREQRTVIARAGREHLISLCQHVDRTGGIGHDLLCQPVLERRDHPVIAIVDDLEGVPRLVLLLDHHLLTEIRPLLRERVVGGWGAAITSSATIVAAPSCWVRRSLRLPRNILAPVPRILRSRESPWEPKGRDLPASSR